MAYLDRLREGRYTTPVSRQEFTFFFDGLERSGAKKAAVHELPQQDTPEVQDLGNRAQSFPVTATFYGTDYDLTADAFAKGLAERGPGDLQHPRWGDMLALPLTWKQSEGFVDGMGRAVFEIEFVRVDPARFPTASASIESNLKAQLDAAQQSATDAFVKDFNPANAADLAACKKDMTDGATDLVAQCKETIAMSADVSAQVNDALTKFNSTIDTLVTDPQALADGILNLSRMPAQVDASIRGKIDNFSGALANTIAAIPGSTSESAGVFLRMFGLSEGIVESSLTGSLADRADAVGAAQAVQDAMAALQGGAEGTEATGYFVPAEVLAQVRAMMAAAAALLLEKAFSLRTARKLVLSGDRTPLDLISELSGPFTDGDSLEAALDSFITQNALQGDRLLMIPSGTEVSFYA